MTISKALGVLVLLFGLTAAASDADARPRPAGRTRQSNFEANKTFGLGLMFGDPTGLSGKYYLGPDTAIDFGVGGGGYGYGHRRGLHIHVDYLWHPISLVSADAFELPLYFGVGGRLWHFDDYDNNNDPYDDVNALGVRVPVGIAFDFNNVPLDIFFELGLVFDFFFNDYRDDFGVHGLGAIGIRYYFN
jgi:hypothetical protein